MPGSRPWDLIDISKIQSHFTAAVQADLYQSKESTMRASTALIVMAIQLIFGINSAHGFDPILTFEGMKQGELVHDYYNGGFALTGNNGLGGPGSGPGAAYGVSFTNDGVVLTDGKHYVGEPSSPGVMLLGDNSVPGGASVSVTMNAPGGFINNLSFFYASIDAPGLAQIYSGVDGTGSLLAQITLPITTPSVNPANPIAFFNSAPVYMQFLGVAQSAVFKGGNQQILFDDIGFVQSIPEPGPLTYITLTGALLIVCVKSRRATALRTELLPSKKHTSATTSKGSSH